MELMVLGSKHTLRNQLLDLIQLQRRTFSNTLPMKNGTTLNTQIQDIEQFKQLVMEFQIIIITTTIIISKKKLGFMRWIWVEVSLLHLII